MSGAGRLLAAEGVEEQAAEDGEEDVGEAGGSEEQRVLDMRNPQVLDDVLLQRKRLFSAHNPSGSRDCTRLPRETKAGPESSSADSRAAANCAASPKGSRLLQE